jgi:hypothetical protein
MKKMMKKMFAMLTAFAAAAVMTVPVSGFAVDSPTADAAPAHKLETSTQTANIPIKKDILVFNSERKRVYEPNIVYSYSIAPANVTNASISTKNQNGEAVVLAVRPGILEAITALKDSGDADSAMVTADGAKTGTITFKSDHTTMKMTNMESDVPYQVSNDYKFRRQMDIVLDAGKIYDVPDDEGVQDGDQDNEPGVYRYKLTEITTDETYTQAGITEGSAGDVIYLDVYTKYNETGDGLLIYGYVLLKDTADGDNTSITYNEETPSETEKIEGFVTESEGDDNADQTVVPADFKGDKYLTYNVDIKELVAGDLADRQHEFPFHIELTNAYVTSGPDFSINDGKTHSNTSLSADGIWDSEDFKVTDAAITQTNPTHKTIDFDLKYNEMISLIGLPAGTTVRVTELNNAPDIYAVSVTCNALSKPMVNEDETKIGNSISIPTNGTAGMLDPFAISLKTESDKIIVTNTLTDISVTGLIFDIAPFIFMTAAGVVLLFVFWRNRKRNDNKNVI